MKKINLIKLKNILKTLSDKPYRIYYSKYDNKLVNEIIANDPNLKYKYVNYDYKNNINYILLLSKNCGALLQNKKTKLNKSFAYLKDTNDLTLLFLRNER